MENSSTFFNEVMLPAVEALRDCIARAPSLEVLVQMRDDARTTYVAAQMDHMSTGEFFSEMQRLQPGRFPLLPWFLAWPLTNAVMGDGGLFPASRNLTAYDSNHHFSPYLWSYLEWMKSGIIAYAHCWMETQQTLLPVYGNAHATMKPVGGFTMV